MMYDSVPDQVYTVYTPAIDWTADPFTMEPACGYTLDYQIRVKDPLTGSYSPLPSFIKYKGGFDFIVETNDPANVGNYLIAITGSVPTQFMDPVYTEDLEFNLEVNNDCQLDIVTATSTIDDETYIIAADGVRKFEPTWTTTVPGCPVTFEIGIVENGVERPFAKKETDVITYNPADGRMSYRTSDFLLD